MPNVNRLATRSQGVGGKVSWIKNTVDETNRAEWSKFLAMNKPEVAQWVDHVVRRGLAGNDIYPNLEVLAEDRNSLKHRFAVVRPLRQLPGMLPSEELVGGGSDALEMLQIPLARPFDFAVGERRGPGDAAEQ